MGLNKQSGMWAMPTGERIGVDQLAKKQYPKNFNPNTRFKASAHVRRGNQLVPMNVDISLADLANLNPSSPEAALLRNRIGLQYFSPEELQAQTAQQSLFAEGAKGAGRQPSSPAAPTQATMNDFGVGVQGAQQGAVSPTGPVGQSVAGNAVQGLATSLGQNAALGALTGSALGPVGLLGGIASGLLGGMNANQAAEQAAMFGADEEGQAQAAKNAPSSVLGTIASMAKGTGNTGIDANGISGDLAGMTGFGMSGDEAEAMGAEIGAMSGGMATEGGGTVGSLGGTSGSIGGPMGGFGVSSSGYGGGTSGSGGSGGNAGGTGPGGYGGGDAGLAGDGGGAGGGAK